MGGAKWLQCFWARHPNLVIRLAENTERVRGYAVSPQTLANMIEALGPRPGNRWWCFDEWGFDLMNESDRSVVAEKGAKMVQVQYDGNRERISVGVAFSQTGEWALHFIVIGQGGTAGTAARLPSFVAAHHLGVKAYFSFTANATQTRESWRHWIRECYLKLPDTAVLPGSVLVVDGHTSHGDLEAETRAPGAHDAVAFKRHRVAARAAHPGKRARRASTKPSDDESIGNG